MDLRIFTEPQAGASYDQIVTMAKEAERLGFDAFFRSDHYIAFEGEGLPGSTDAWITLAGLARETSTIRLGTLVTPVTFRWPGPLAISVAQVDAMSSGRVELGLGTGWHDVEHAAYGIPFPSTKDRFNMFEEQCAIVSGLWSTPVGERFSFAGSHYQLTDSPALPKPVQRDARTGGVPLVIGGWGAKRTPAIAARYGAEFNLPFGPADIYGAMCDPVRAACEAIDRDPATMVWSHANTVVCGSDEAEIERRAATIGHKVEDLRAHQLCGTPSELIDQIGRFAAAGAQRTYLQVLDFDDLDHLRLIAEQVLPALR